MQKYFKIYIIGKISYFNSLQVSQKEKGIFISQIKYVKEMLNFFIMDDCNLVSTPMMICCKLSKDDKSPPIDQTMYRSIIGSLLYLKMTRLDIL